MLLVDFSQIVMSGIIINLTNELKRPGVEPESLIKHMIITSLLGLKQKFGNQYGEMVLCIDSKNYWRRDIFPWYKGQRKHSRDKSDLDFDLIYKVINEMKADIRDNFPWTLIEVDGAEADDVIACMCKWLQENQLSGNGVLLDSPQETLICSSDGDFKQLQKYENVSQWSSQHKKWVKETHPLQYLAEHTITGDTGDNIPNILTSDKWAEDRAANTDEKDRQKPFSKSRFPDFYAKGIDACKTEEEKRNWIRNNTLVNFDCIPESLYNKIIHSYTSYEKKGNKTKLTSYLVQNRMKKIFESLGAF